MGDPLLTSDPHAWLRPYYAKLTKQTGFAHLAPSLRFSALLETIAKEHPSKAAELRGWNDAAQRGLLGWLADVVAQRPPAPATELWRVRKDTRELRCVAVYLSTGIDVRLMDRDDFRRTELVRDAPSARVKAEEWRRMLTTVGWTNRQPLTTIPAGSRVRLVKAEGEWLLVIYRDPGNGERQGYVPRSAARPLSSAPDAPTARSVVEAPITSTQSTAASPNTAAQTASSARPQTEHNSSVAEAFARASRTRPVVVGCYAGPSFMDMSVTNGGFSVVVEGPIGRIASAAAEAKKMYKPFTVADVTEAMAEEIITVTATPSKPEFGPTHLALVKTDNGSPNWHSAPLAKHVVIKTRPSKGGNPVVLQPTDATPITVSWSNAMGGTFTGQGVVARFDAMAFHALPPGDLDVAVISDIDAERTCKIGSKDALKVQ